MSDSGRRVEVWQWCLKAALSKEMDGGRCREMERSEGESGLMCSVEGA